MHKEQIMIVLNENDAIEMQKKFPGRYIVIVNMPPKIIKLTADEIYLSDELNEKGSKRVREEALKLACSYIGVKPKEKVEKTELVIKTKVEDIQIRFIDGEIVDLKAVTKRKENSEHFMFFDDTSLLFVAKKDEVKYIKTVK